MTIAATSTSAQEFPLWLNKATPDADGLIKKAAYCASHRDLLFEGEIRLVATVILWGHGSVADHVEIDRIFARILKLSQGLRWVEHPNCHPLLKAATLMGREFWGAR